MKRQWQAVNQQVEVADVWYAYSMPNLPQGEFDIGKHIDFDVRAEEFHRTDAQYLF